MQTSAKIEHFNLSIPDLSFPKLQLWLWFLSLFDVGVDAVFTDSRLTITASCPMNLQYFPMDRQLCHIEIESCEYRIVAILGLLVVALALMFRNEHLPNTSSYLNSHHAHV